jgi:hypothetical protein
MSEIPNSRFGTLFKKIKAKPGEGSDEFDPTLEESPQPVIEKKAESKKKQKLSKKNNPDYTQTTVYIRLKTYNEVRKRLIDERGKRDYSDLVNLVLEKWLSKK